MGSNLRKLPADARPFLRSSEAKKRLEPALMPGNLVKALTAPVLAVIAYDSAFYLKMGQLFPHRPEAGRRYAENRALADTTALRNGSLQAAYFMLAVRAVGHDVGPMSGFDADKVNAEFFADSSLRVNFLCGIGCGDPDQVFERLPRLEFEEATLTL